MEVCPSVCLSDWLAVRLIVYGHAIMVIHTYNTNIQPTLYSKFSIRFYGFVFSFVFVHQDKVFFVKCINLQHECFLNRQILLQQPKITCRFNAKC